jgi:carbon-monoxide dehydrogenase large subunit
LETVCAQIAADALEVSLHDIAGVFHGSTDHVSEGYGSYSSRSVVMGGNAILAAADKLRDAVREAAAARWGCPPADVEIDGEVVRTRNGRSLPISTFAGLVAEAGFTSNKRTYSYGAHAAHVAVDPKTGAIELIDYVAVEDVGRIINPRTLHGQAVGAIVQGLGGALLEHFVYDQEGQLLTGSFADYLLPTASEFPNIRVIALEQKPSPTNPLGAKGAGEGGIIPVGGVVANAVAKAGPPYRPPRITPSRGVAARRLHPGYDPSATTRRSICPINSARSASAVFSAALLCSDVLLFEPNRTTPPSSIVTETISATG